MAQYDSVCKFLLENFPTDFATWLLGEPINLTTLDPSELSVEPIRADALMLLQSQALILHIEFQTRPKPDIPFRMLDYRIRCHRRYPDKPMRQVVIYLKRTTSGLTQQTTFELENTYHRFEVVRLWEQPLEAFLSVPGLLPFAILSQAEDKEGTLRQVASRVQELPDPDQKTSIKTIVEVIAGLELESSIVRQIMESSIFSESSVYQEIIAKGKAEGKAEGRAEVIEHERSLLTRQLIRKIGVLSNEQRAKVSQLSQSQLDLLGEALLDFSSLEDLTEWLQSNA